MLVISLILVTIITFAHGTAQGAAEPHPPPPQNNASGIIPPSASIQDVIDHAKQQIRSDSQPLSHRIEHLFSLIDTIESIKDDSDFRVYEKAIEDIMTFMQSEEHNYYPLYTTFAFQYKLYRRFTAKNKNAHNNAFRVVEPWTIYNFYPCIIQKNLQFLQSVTFDQAIVTTIASTNIPGSDIADTSQLVASMKGKMSQGKLKKWVGSDYRLLQKVEKFAQDSNYPNVPFKGDDVEMFLRLVAKVFRIQIIILDAKTTNNQDYTYEIIDAKTLRDDQQLRTGDITGTVYLFSDSVTNENINPEYRPVIPRAENYPYPVENGCFGKTVVEEMAEAKKARLTSKRMPPGVKKSPAIMQSLKSKQQSKDNSDSVRSSRNSKKQNSKKTKREGIFDKNTKIIVIIACVLIFCLLAICAGLCFALKSRS